jgi:metal-responsive CopG/Arc/MetJ family transcriptional regulator
MMIRNIRIGISIPKEIFDEIETIRTKSNRSQFILELIRPELERRMASNV